MANFLFWNVGRKQVSAEISSLCAEHDVDVLILAESEMNTINLLLALNAQTTRTYIAPFNPSSRIQFLTRYPLDALKPILDEGGIAVRTVRPPIGMEILLFAVHLPSKLHWSDNEQTINAIRLADIIRQVEKRTGNKNSILLGDFNMNPFEDGMVSADGIHAVMDQVLARKLSRKVGGVSRDYFYNPMWSRLGDESVGPPGTYFSRGGQISQFWHTFDQVLLRPSLLDFYSSSALKIVTKIGGVDLLRGGSINRDVSDHLPVLIGLSIENGVSS
jgi:hypothetical protein